MQENLVVSQKSITFALANENSSVGSVAQLD